MRDFHDAAYAVDKLQQSYDEAREAGKGHAEAIFGVAEQHDIDSFKVAALVRDPEAKTVYVS